MNLRSCRSTSSDRAEHAATRRLKKDSCPPTICCFWSLRDQICRQDLFVNSSSLLIPLVVASWRRGARTNTSSVFYRRRPRTVMISGVHSSGATLSRLNSKFLGRAKRRSTGPYPRLACCLAEETESVSPCLLAKAIRSAGRCEADVTKTSWILGRRAPFRRERGSVEMEPEEWAWVLVVVPVRASARFKYSSYSMSPILSCFLSFFLLQFYLYHFVAPGFHSLPPRSLRAIMRVSIVIYISQDHRGTRRRNSPSPSSSGAHTRCSECIVLV